MREEPGRWRCVRRCSSWSDAKELSIVTRWNERCEWDACGILSRRGREAWRYQFSISRGNVASRLNAHHGTSQNKRSALSTVVKIPRASFAAHSESASHACCTAHHSFCCCRNERAGIAAHDRIFEQPEVPNQALDRHKYLCHIHSFSCRHFAHALGRNPMPQTISAYIGTEKNWKV